jgi:hypothetical protein
VFGKIAKRKLTNILVTRESVQNVEYVDESEETVIGVKKQQAIVKLDAIKGLDMLQKSISAQNNRINKEVSELMRMLREKNRLMGRPDPVAEVKTTRSKPASQHSKSKQSQSNQGLPETMLKVPSLEQPETDIFKMIEGNLSSYRTSNLDYGSLVDELDEY